MELFWCSVIALGAGLVYFTQWRRSARRPVLVPLLAAGTFGASWMNWRPTADEFLELKLPRRVEKDGFVSSDSCRACHPGHYASWHQSYHRTMTQVAGPETVLAPFDDLRLENRGRSYHLQRRGEQFWVTMPDPDWEDSMQIAGVDLSQVKDPPTVTKRVLLVTGSHHMQNYWVPSTRGNELYMLPFCYHLEEQRWFPSEDSFLKPPDAPRSFSHWNSNCIRCHALAGNPGLDPRTIDMKYNPSGILNSEVVEFGISCEACHGPAAEHIEFHRKPWNRLADREAPDPTIVNPARCSPQVQSEICGQCHSNFVEADLEGSFVNGLGYRAGGPLAASHSIVRFDPEDAAQKAKSIYWQDGACCVGGDEYNGLIESPCYQRGELSCLSCHSMHDSDPNDQLARDRVDNRACTQCHTESRFTDRLAGHTHHASESAGSLCYNCHMPHTSYALMTAMRSHRIDSPDAGVSARTGRPNACNLCHLDQTLAWAAGHLSDWYGSPAVELSAEEQTVAASLLWLLRGDPLQRAIAAWHLGWDSAHEASGRDWQSPFLAHMLDDPYATVRFLAKESLRGVAGQPPADYDFVGAPEHRAQVRQALMNGWRHQPDKPDSERSARLLIRDGVLDADALSRLVQQRNDRPTTIPE